MLAVSIREAHRSGLCGALLVVALLFSPAAALPATIGSFQIYQTDFYGLASPPVLASEWGDLDVVFDPGSDPFTGYLQLYISTGGPPVLAIANMPVPSNAQLEQRVTISRFFDLRVIGIERGTPVPGLLAGVVITPATADFGLLPPPPLLPVTVAPRFYEPGFGIAEGSLPGTREPGSAPSADISTTPGLAAPDVILRTDVPDVEEGNNECGLGAITRSILWLKNNGAIDDPVTTSGIFEGVRNASNWNGVDGIPTYADTLRAKLKVTKDLDVHNKFMVRRPSSVPAGDFETSDGKAISNGNDPTFEFIKKELENGEDIEITVGWLDADGTRTSGHLMTVVGASDTSAGKEITVQDDPNQGTTDTKNQRRSTPYVDKGTTAPYLPSLPRNRVEMVISESPKPKVTSATAASAASATLEFNAPMGLGVLDPTNYTISGPGQGTVASTPSGVSPAGGNTYLLSWGVGAMVAGAVATVTVSEGVQDSGGNPVGSQNAVSFIATGPSGVANWREYCY